MAFRPIDYPFVMSAHDCPSCGEHEETTFRLYRLSDGKPGCDACVEIDQEEIDFANANRADFPEEFGPPDDDREFDLRREERDW